MDPFSRILVMLFSENAKLVQRCAANSKNCRLSLYELQCGVMTFKFKKHGI